MTTVEYAGATSCDDHRLTRAGVVARAPEWWRRLADKNLRSAAADKASPRQRVASKASPPVAGWVHGFAICGISEPAYAAADGRTICEQFTTAALADMVKEVSSGKRVVPLTWGHRGEVLATNRGLDMLLSVDQFYNGLTFTARLRESELNRRVLEDLERGVLGVSVGYHSADGTIIDRRGFGPVRLIDKATLHHIALLRRDSKLVPAYRACWASGRRGRNLGCPQSVRDEARRFAYTTMVQQAKVMG